ncbi:MAG: cell division protein ZapB [Treponema sp.]|nr:cell division protein ZapB [Treponema sp.]
MIRLEQVKLLESKVTTAIEYVRKVTEENSALKGKLGSYQKRIDELEVLIHQFKEEQSRIEDGILSALDRLNQFEDALEKTLSAGGAPSAGKALPEKDSPAKKKNGDSALPEEPEPQPEPAPSGEPKPSEELDIF